MIIVRHRFRELIGRRANFGVSVVICPTGSLGWTGDWLLEEGISDQVFGVAIVHWKAK